MNCCLTLLSSVFFTIYTFWYVFFLRGGALGLIKVYSAELDQVTAKSSALCDKAVMVLGLAPGRDPTE